MEFVNMKPLVDKIKTGIVSNSNLTIYVFTDDNDDNLSYIKGLQKINSKEQYVKEIVPIKIVDEKVYSDFCDEIKSKNIDEIKIYLMNSIINHPFTNDFIEKYKKIKVYSEVREGVYKLIPTPNAIIDTIKYQCGEDLSGLNVVVASRSNLIGRPVINKLLDANATVICCHTKTDAKVLQNYFAIADIIVTASGKPNTFFIENNVHKLLIIDAGINVIDGKVVGDWDMKCLEKLDNIHITPNPGGIGKLTTYELFNEIIKI